MMKFALLLPAMLLGSVVNPGPRPTTWSPSTGITYLPGPRIADSSDTVCHTYFDATGVHDTKTCVWDPTGSPTIVAPVGNAPYGANFSTTAYYTLHGSANDVLDLSGADFMVCALYKVQLDNHTETIFSNGVSTDNAGYNFAIGTPYFNFALYGSSVTYTASNQYADSAVAAGAGEVGCYCGGRSGNNAYAQANFTLRTVTAAASPVAGTASYARIGVSAALAAPASGTLYELVWFNTGPTKVRVDQLCAKALATF